MSARFAIGIDLGTTNTALGHASLDDADRDQAPAVLSLSQLVAPSEVAQAELLPSFLFLPTAAESEGGAFALPWSGEEAPTQAVGVLAKERAGAVPGRVIASAKSWLCHPGVDRQAGILPFGATADDDVTRLSPVQVQAELLAHLRAAWDHQHPDAPLADQKVVLTVPASFDAVAKSLTEEAARAAGLPADLVLLEEPQAALYAWIAGQGEDWRKVVGPGDVLLVVDIGGGTTDFSLIEVQDQDGSLALERVAVGEHILLGGDNMDLALAYQVRAALEEEGRSIDDWQLRALTHAARQAKETLLEDESLDTQTVVIPGRGSKLLGGSVKGEVTRSMLDQLVLEGFLPRVEADARPEKPRRAGLATLGLPYAHDAAITRHLAAFLGGAGRAPTAVLFNGGVTRSGAVQKRLVEVLDHWAGAAGAVKVLAGADLDLAVAKGAAAYARVRENKQGLRIKGGTARAYYVGIERAELAVPGIPPRIDAICIAPRGMEEGTGAELKTTLGLVVGEPATFRFFASHTREGDVAGAVLDPKKDGLEEIAPIETTLPGEPGLLKPVTLTSRVTELGALELFAVEEGGTRHKLEFQIRAQ
jgi:molecular chaperone DnaK (HSP70)